MSEVHLSDGDRAWLETRFKAILDKQGDQDTRIGDLQLEVVTLEVGSAHKCAAAIEKHEAGSWSHNPYKAGGFVAALVGIVEGARKIFSGH
jgi:hypothetical protein